MSDKSTLLRQWWYDALACGHPDPDGYANKKLAAAFPRTPKKDTGVREGSRAGRRQYSLRRRGC